MGELGHALHLVKGHSAVLRHQQRGGRTPPIGSDGHGGRLTARGAPLLYAIAVQEGRAGQMEHAGGHDIVVQRDAGIDEGEGDGIDGRGQDAYTDHA